MFYCLLNVFGKNDDFDDCLYNIKHFYQNIFSQRRENMKYKKSLLILIMAIFLVSIAGVCASDANDTAIASDDSNQMELSSDSEISEDNLQTGEENSILTQNDDETLNAEIDSQTLGADEGTFQELRNEIGNGGDKNLSKSYYRYNSGNAIQIKNPGVINGNGAIIDMAGASIRVFYVTISGVTIKDLTIINAKINTGSGGAIYFSSSGTVENCNFTNNVAGDNAGAVNFAESGTVTNCNFAGNRVTGSNSYGGAIRMPSGTVSNCNFTNNTANRDGGAVYFSGNGTVSNCNFTNNTANRDGGAVYFSGNGTLLNSNFTDNQAYNSGAIYFSGKGAVSNSNFVGNKATGDGSCGGAIYMNSGTVSNCNFADSTANDKGGAVYFSGNGTVSNSNFVGNKATGNGSCGGAIYMNSGTVSNGNFADNIVNDDGGAIWISSGSVSNSNFTNNTVNRDGGAVYFAESGTVSNSNFTNNTAGNNAGALFQGNPYNCVFIGNRADGGGAMYEGFATNCKFIENHADGFGGVINGYNHKSINCTFISNSAGISGGALSGGEAHNCSFISNVASRDGGAINDANAHNCNFTGNKATSGSGGAIYFSAYGNVTNCNFTNNTAYSNGGAISIFSYSYGYSYGGDVENCNFINNIADNGGAIYTRSARATICNFVNNVARVSGGAMFDGVADTCIFKTGSDTVKNTLRLLPKWAVDNFITAYDSGEKLTFDLKTSSGMLVENGNISISVYYNDNGSWFGNYSCLSGEGWAVNLPVGYYYAIYGTEYYGTEPVTRTIRIDKASSDMNVSDVSRDYGNSTGIQVATKGAIGITAKIDDNNATVVGNTIMIPSLDVGTYVLTVTTIPDSNHLAATKTAKIIVNKINTQLAADPITLIYNTGGDLTVTLKDVRGNPLANQQLFVYFNGAKTFDLTDLNGTIKVPVIGLAPNTYGVEIVFKGNDIYNESNVIATVTVNKDSTSLSADAITAVYNVNKNLVITLKDSRGNPIDGAAVTVDLNGAKTYTTDSKGQIKVATANMVPKVYTAKITFNGDANYDGSSKDVKVTVKKATPKLTAKKVTLKAKTKTKKYAVTLKDNVGKAMNKVQITLKVKGKTYKATTNAKGKATFKIKKLAKKGTYKATVTFKGNGNYNKITKTVKIKVK